MLGLGDARRRPQIARRLCQVGRRLGGPHVVPARLGKESTRERQVAERAREAGGGLAIGDAECGSQLLGSRIEFVAPRFGRARAGPRSRALVTIAHLT